MEETRIKVRIPDTFWVYVWWSKEEGSHCDHNLDTSHPAHFLRNKKGYTANMTISEIQAMIKSGEYQSTSWNDDEIEGGARTKNAIANFVRKLKEAIKIRIVVYED